VSAVVVVGSSFPLRAQSASADAPTYTRDVAPILYKNCTGCHRPGEIADAADDTRRPSARARNLHARLGGDDASVAR
jgi:hypothetical protein